jgi:peptidoglycan hydrolase-like protein with peptidoglycan-binding domain
LEAAGVKPKPAKDHPKDCVLPTLKRGAKGNYVKGLQSTLNRAINAKLQEDGQFGPATEIAVRNFQKFFKLQVDGIVGPKTWQALGDILRAVGR